MSNPNAQTGSNAPEFSVSDLASALKATLENNFSHIRVRGELSRVSVAASGHLYTSLKDNNAVIDAVCWKGVLARQPVRPEEGLEVICTGKISSYAKSSKYQLIIETMELAGQGALLKMLEDRKRKLAAEGLFDPTRKQPLPLLPSCIGVVTSETGAVIRDILHRLDDRFPRPVMVWPTLVQGPHAAEQIAAGIEGLQRLGEHGLPQPDVIIVARGGGSLEDLMAFNEEVVVRAAAACTIPLISAVGHETDTTLIDYAADVRAPTPTGAAEMAVPVRAELMGYIADQGARVAQAAARLLEDKRGQLMLLAKSLGDPLMLINAKTQQLDMVSVKLQHNLQHLIAQNAQRVLQAAARLKHPRDILAMRGQSLSRWGEQLQKAGGQVLDKAQQRLTHADKMLQAYSFQNVLKRGFTVVRDADGALITQAEALAAGQSVDIEFYQGQKRRAVVDGAASVATAPAKPAKPSKPKPKKTDDRQSSLF